MVQAGLMQLLHVTESMGPALKRQIYSSFLPSHIILPVIYATNISQIKSLSNVYLIIYKCLNIQMFLKLYTDFEVVIQVLDLYLNFGA